MTCPYLQSKRQTVAHMFASNKTHPKTTTFHTMQHINNQIEQRGDEIIIEQATDSCCFTATLYIGTTQSESCSDIRGILVWKSRPDESIRIVNPALLQRKILYLYHYPPIAKHPGQRKLYDTLWRNIS